MQCSVFPTAPKIFPKSLIWLCCLFWSQCALRHAERRYAIYCLCFCSIVFSGRAWLIYQLCRSRWPYVEVCDFVPTEAPRTLPEPWLYLRAKESLGALSLQYDAIEAHFQVDFCVVLPSQWPTWAAADMGQEGVEILRCKGVIVRTENKDPNNVLTTFICFIFFVVKFKSSKFEMGKGTDTKTR